MKSEFRLGNGKYCHVLTITECFALPFIKDPDWTTNVYPSC